MSTSDANTIAAWNNASANINRYFSIIIFLFGTIGNILNTLVLSQRTLRRNPCSLFFLVSSIANLGAILSGLTTRMLAGWTLDLTNTIDWLCKLRGFVLFLFRNIAGWLIMLAALDRWLLSCVNVRRRHLSSLKNAQRGIVLTVLFSIVLYSPIFYCYAANLINTPLKCYGKTDTCRLSNDLIYAGVTIILPICLMLVFGFLTISNIRQVRVRVHASTNRVEMNPMDNSFVTLTQAVVTKRKIDRRLFLMLCVQVILFSIFTLPQAIQKIYSTVTANQVLTPVTQAMNNFLFNLVLLLTYFANGMPFYIYTLSGGTIFRNALKAGVQKLAQKIRCGN